MHLPGWPSLPLECAFETVERLDRGPFPDLRCGRPETRYESRFGHSRNRLTVMARNSPPGYREVRCPATSGASEPPEQGGDPSGCHGYGSRPFRIDCDGSKHIDYSYSGTLVLRTTC